MSDANIESDKTVAYSTAPANAHINAIGESLVKNYSRYTPRRPSNEVIITSIAGSFGATYREACDWIVEIAESLKETA